MHQGHRERLRNRFLAQDIDGFEEVNALELLLFYAIPQRDTNPIAHELIKRFGSIVNVFDAPYEELKKVKGMGAASAALIKMIPSFGRYYSSKKGQVGTILRDAEAAGAFLIPKFIGVNREVIYFIGMDAKGKILFCERISEGTINATALCIRKIAQMALLQNAVNVIIAHNHPGGLALPSNDDLASTIEIERGLALLNITLADHIIVAEEDFVSLNQSGFIGRPRR